MPAARILPGLLGAALAACTAAPPVTPDPAPTPASAPVRLHGRVMRDGRPVVGMVLAMRLPASGHPGQLLEQAIAGDDGCFAFRAGLTPGQYEVYLEDHRPPLQHGSQRPWVARRTLTVTPGETLPAIDFVLR